MDLTFYSRFLCNTVLCSIGFYFCQQTHQQMSVLPLWPSRFFHSRAIGSFPLLLPSSVLDTFRPGGLIFWCLIFLAFYAVHEVLTESILWGFAIPSSSGSRFVRILCYDPSILSGPAQRGL